MNHNKYLEKKLILLITKVFELAEMFVCVNTVTYSYFPGYSSSS